jgi:hypothetical protein
MNAEDVDEDAQMRDMMGFASFGMQKPGRAPSIYPILLLSYHIRFLNVSSIHSQPRHFVVVFHALIASSNLFLRLKHITIKHVAEA